MIWNMTSFWFHTCSNPFIFKCSYNGALLVGDCTARVIDEWTRLEHYWKDDRGGEPGISGQTPSQVPRFKTNSTLTGKELNSGLHGKWPASYILFLCRLLGDHKVQYTWTVVALQCQSRKWYKHVTPHPSVIKA